MESTLVEADKLIVAAGPRKGQAFGLQELDYLKKVVQRNPGDDRLRNYARAKVALAEMGHNFDTASAPPAVAPSLKETKVPEAEEKAEDTCIPLQKKHKGEPTLAQGWFGRLTHPWLCSLRNWYSRVEWHFMAMLFVLWSLLALKPQLSAQAGKFAAKAVKQTAELMSNTVQHFFDELWTELGSAETANSFAKAIKHELAQDNVTTGNIHITITPPRQSFTQLLNTY